MRSYKAFRDRLAKYKLLTKSDPILPDDSLQNTESKNFIIFFLYFVTDFP